MPSEHSSGIKSNLHFLYKKKISEYVNPLPECRPRFHVDALLTDRIRLKHPVIIQKVGQ